MRLCLIHWHTGEATEHRKRLRELGRTVGSGAVPTPEAAGALREGNLPDARFTAETRSATP